MFLSPISILYRHIIRHCLPSGTVIPSYKSTLHPFTHHYPLHLHTHTPSPQLIRAYIMGILPPPSSSPCNNITGIGHGANWGQGHNYHPEAPSFWPLGPSSFESGHFKPPQSQDGGSTFGDTVSENGSWGGKTLVSAWNGDAAFSFPEKSVSDLKAALAGFHPTESEDGSSNGTT